MTADARVCPRCGSPMVLRTAGRGRYEGQRFWGCSTYPRCKAIIGVKSDIPESELELAGAVVSPAGASAQVEYERYRARNRERLRRQWPYAVGVTLIVVLVVYLVVQSFSDARWGSAAAAFVALGLLAAFVKAPHAEAWREGALGERKTAHHLEGLGEAGFVVLHDRKVPGYGGNLDHVVIGPTGVWAIETKSWRGNVEIDGDALTIRGYRQDKMVDQVYREATAVQIALGESATRLGLNVTPVLCFHRGKLPWFNKTVRGVRLASGSQLVRLLRDGDERLSATQVQELAREADRLLRPAVPRTPG